MSPSEERDSGNVLREDKDDEDWMRLMLVRVGAGTGTLAPCRLLISGSPSPAFTTTLLRCTGRADPERCRGGQGRIPFRAKARYFHSGFLSQGVTNENVV